MKPLLVALDGSSHADASLPVAIGLARHLRTALHLVSVLESDPWRYATGGAPFTDRTLEREHAAEWRATMQHHLDVTRTRISALPDAPAVSARVLPGPVAETLLGEATAVDAGMIIVTTHGRGGLSRSWIGSVTDALVRTAPLPILAIRPGEPPPTTDTVSDWHLHRVLVALDGSCTAEQILPPLRALLTGDTECILMRAVTPLHPMLRAVATGTEYERDLAEQRALVTAYLRSVEGRLQQEGLRVSHCAHEEFDPPRAVCECAESLSADLIAVATRARGPLPRALVGSVADKILRTATRPVLLYRVVDPSTGTS